MSLKSKLQNYDITRPLHDNLTQVKNAVEAIVSIIIRTRLPFLQVTLVHWFGEEIAVELMVLTGVAETVIIYYIISGIEYLSKGDDYIG